MGRIFYQDGATGSYPEKSHFKEEMPITYLPFSSFILLGFALVFTPGEAAAARAAPKNELQRFHVVLDPGHGGADEGAAFRAPRQLLREKDVTLLIAQEVARQLRARGIEVTLTRTTDADVPLAVRTSFANRLGADVFISLHLNSTQAGHDPHAEGIETYILNNTSDASSRRLAQLENSVIGAQLEEVASDQTDVALILKDLQLDGNLGESRRLACLLQANLVRSARTKNAHARDRGVKQALFHVLLGADMPSALIEAGFLSHAQDRALMTTLMGRRTLAQGVAQAILRFKEARSPALARRSPRIGSSAALCASM